VRCYRGRHHRRGMHTATTSRGCRPSLSRPAEKSAFPFVRSNRTFSPFILVLKCKFPFIHSIYFSFYFSMYATSTASLTHKLRAQGLWPRSSKLSSTDRATTMSC
jgi:hypothetical protein